MLNSGSRGGTRPASFRSESRASAGNSAPAWVSRMRRISACRGVGSLGLSVSPPAAHLSAVTPCQNCAHDYNPDALTGPKTQNPQDDELAIDAGRIGAILDTIGLKAHRDRLAGALSHGQKQWLEIGMLIAQNPKLLLVDEPVAGMTDAETRTTAELLKDIAKSHTVIVVEHDMEFVRMLGVKVTVLHEGSVLAEGSIDEVSANERVVEVYLGR